MQEQSSSLLLWVRRAAAILLAMVFVPALIIAIAFSGGRSAAVDPDFWIERLQEADFYTFIHDPFVPYILDEAFDETDEPRLLALEPFKDDIAEAVRVGIPPRDIRQVTEDAIYSMWPYLTGESESFEVNVALAARTRIALESLAESIRTADGAAYEAAFEDLVILMAEQLDEELDELPIVADVSKEDTEAYVREIATREWLFGQMANAINESAPYVIGDVDELEITIPVSERAEAIDSVMTDLLTDPDLVADVAEQSLTLVLAGYLPADPIEIPGLSALTADSLATVILMSMSPSEMTEMTRIVVGDFADYATGQSDTFGGADARIILATARDNVPGLMAQQADDALAGRFRELPVCESTDIPSVAVMPLNIAQALPACVAEGLTYEQYKAAIGLDLEQLARDEVVPLIPLNFTIDEGIIRSEMDPAIIERIDEMRGWMTDGYSLAVHEVFTEGVPEDIDILRETIRDGILFTEADFEDAFGADPDADVLKLTVWASDAGQILVWLPSILLLVILALVGGRGWDGRLTWASVSLGIGAGLTWIGAAFLLDRVLRPILTTGLDAWLSEGATNVVQREFTLRVNTFADGVLSGLADNIQSQALLILLIAGVTLLVARLLAADSVGRRPSGR